MKGRIRQEDIDEVRNRISLVEIAAEYMQVRKAGATRFKALCPFHQEKTPSFSIDSAKNLWHCFGCQKGGDVVTLVSELENLTFAETMERLAAKAGVQLTYERVSPAERETAGRKQRLIAAHREAAAFYHERLMKGADAKGAREYLKTRNLTKETVEAFQLGWSPAGWDELCRHLTRKRFSENELIDGGLALRSERGGIIDRYRERIMFPTFDVAGEPVGFGGRILDETAARAQPGRTIAKYINTAETPIHHKGRVLYGLNWAKKAIATAEVALVVEGYMDVIALHQAGVTEALATNGTALSLDHFRMLMRFAPKAIVAFDSDNAGAKAVERAFDAALESGIDARVLILPEGKDPADVAAEGGEKFRELTKGAVPIVEYQLKRAIGRFDLSDPEGRARAVRAGVPILVRVSDQVMKRDYTGRLAEWTHQDPNVVFIEVGRVTGDPTALAAPALRRTSAQYRLERDLLKLALQYPAAIEDYLHEVGPDMFSLPAHRAIWQEVLDGRDAAEMPDRVASEEAKQTVNALALEQIAVDLEIDGTPPDSFVAEAVNRLKDFALARLIAEKKDHLQRINPVEEEAEYRLRYAELIALEGERKRVSGVLAEAGAE